MSKHNRQRRKHRPDNVDPFFEEEVCAAAQELAEQGLLEITVDGNGNKTWALTAAGKEWAKGIASAEGNP
jgi:hypothetical protein